MLNPFCRVLGIIGAGGLGYQILLSLQSLRANVDVLDCPSAVKWRHRFLSAMLRRRLVFLVV